MAMHLLERVQRIPVSLDTLFDFFRDVDNVALLTPAWTAIERVTPVAVAIEEGATVDFRVRVAGIPFRWRTRINRWDPPHAFEEEQVIGPYRHWVHQHRFIPFDGGVAMIDRVRYAFPAGRVGEALHQVAGERVLDGLFDHRARALAAEFGGGPTSVRRTKPRLPAWPAALWRGAA